MQPLDAPTADPLATSETIHIACCIAPVGEPDLTFCGLTQMVESDDGIDWECSCVVCDDLNRSNYCPHDRVCLYVEPCTRRRP